MRQSLLIVRQPFCDPVATIRRALSGGDDPGAHDLPPVFDDGESDVEALGAARAGLDRQAFAFEPRPQVVRAVGRLENAVLEGEPVFRGGDAGERFLLPVVVDLSGGGRGEQRDRTDERERAVEHDVLPHEEDYSADGLSSCRMNV
jgi:hypothetical protein